MDGIEAKGIQSQPMKMHKYSMASQIFLRIAAFVATLAATWLMLTSKQSIHVFGIPVNASYSYASAFKFFAFANLVACFLSLLSLAIAFVFGRQAPYPTPTHYFYMFLHDLVVLVLLIPACAAATAIGYIGRYGNTHTGWMPICDKVGKFCNRVTVSVTVSYCSFVFYLFLAIISASKSRKTQA